MITFLDENDVEYGALATIKATNAVNGERSLTGTIASGDYVLSNIERGWRLRFDDEYYVVTYAKPIDEGRDVQVEFDAVHQFFWDFDKSSVYDQLSDGSHTFRAYLDFIFKNSGYSYTVDTALNVHAFEKQSFGFKKRLTLFNDIITSTGVEFQVNGKVVRILEKVGTDLSTVVRKNFNMNELTIEKNIGDFVTYQKGFGAYFDEEDHSKGRLEVEYTSPLASVYGKLEAEPFVDERYSQSNSLLAVLKENVDNSYTISVSLDMEDLTRAGYKYKQPIAGDYIMAINETLDFQEKIRIVSFTSEYAVDGQLIKHTVTCNDIGSVKKLSAGYNLTKKQAASASDTASNAYSIANKALISADGKNTNYYGDSFPVDNPKGTLKKGDLLFLTVGDTVKQYYWNGADWIINPVLDDVEAFKEHIAEELKDVPNREEFENKIAEELANSKAEIETQIESAKTQAESNAKEYADTINQETAKVAELANAAAGEIKADLVNVKNNLTSTSLVANNAQAAVDAAKQDLANVTSDLNTAKQDLANSVAAVNTKVDSAKAEVTQAKQDLANVASDLNTAKQDLADSVTAVNTKVDSAKAELTQTKKQLTTVADDLSKAKTDLQNAVSAVDTKATNLQSDLSKAKQDLTSQAQQLQAQANAQSELTKRVSSVEKTADGTKTTVSELSKTVAQNGKDITSVTARTKVVEDDLAGTKTTLSQVKTTADSASQKTATLESGLNGLSAKFDNLKIGGRNLLSKTNQGKTNWGWAVSGGGTTAENFDVDGINAVKMTRISDASVTWDYIQYRGLLRNLIEPNTKYTLSFDVKPSVDVTFSATLKRGDGGAPLTNAANMNKATANKWTKISCVLTTKPTLPDDTSQVVYLQGMPITNGNWLIIKNIKLEKGNVATDYSPSEVDFEQKVAEYKQNADQNYASLQTTVQNLDGTVQHNKTVADQTAQGFKTRIESLETYKNGESERANAYFESAKTETAKQLTAERTAIAKDYVAKSTYTSDVTGIRNELSATTSTANATKTNLANYQASNDKMVASLKSSLQTTDGNVSNLQTKVEAVPGQITSAVSAVEGKIPTSAGGRNLALGTSSDWSGDWTNFNGQNNQTRAIYRIYNRGLKVGDKVNVRLVLKYSDIVATDGQTAKILSQCSGNVTAWGAGGLNGQAVYLSPDDNEVVLSGTTTITDNHLRNDYWTWGLRVDYVASGRIQWKEAKAEAGDLPTPWSPAPEDTVSQINNLSSQIQQTADGMTLLATKTELNTAKTELQSGINTATNKANSAQNKANNNAQTISTHTTQISALNTGLQAKVSQSDFNTLSGRVTTAENNITAKANELSSKITSVEGKIPTNVSTRNLILKSNDFAHPHKQAGGANTTVTSTNEYFVIKSTGYTANAWGGMSWKMSISEVKAGEVFSILMPVYIDSSIALDSTFGFNIKNHASNTAAYGYDIPTNKKNEWFNVAITFKAVKDVVFDGHPFYVFITKNGLVRIKPPMLVRGNLIPSDWQPAPEDTISQISSLSSELKQTKDGITLLATKTELNTAKSDLQSGINTATNKANNAQSTANSNAQTISTHTTQISALNTGLQAKVSQSEFNTLSGRVTTAENNITAKANELSSKITAVEGKIHTSVGGRNLLSKTNQGKLNWAWSVSSGGTTAEDYNVDGVKAVKLTRTSDASSSWAYIQYQGLLRKLIEPNTKYTLSFDAKPSVDVTFSATLKRGDGGAPLTNAVNMNKALANQWTKVSCVLTTKPTLPDDLSQVVYLQGMPITNGNWLIIKNIKLEKSVVSSDWSPAPEDTANQISNLSSQIKQTADGMTLLATKTELNTAKTELQSGITTATNKASAAQSTANSAQNKANSNAQTISTHTTQISALNTGLQAKVSQTDFNTLSGRVTTAENNITAKANELTSKITTVEGKIPTSVGGRNLIIKSQIQNGYIDANGNLAAATSQFTTGFIDGTNNKQFTITAPKFVAGSLEWFRLAKYGADKNFMGRDVISYTKDAKTVKTITLSDNVAYFKVSFDGVYKEPFKIERGSLPTDWSPAPEDTVSQISSLSSEIKQTADGMTLLATKTELNSAKNELQSGITTATNKANAAQSTANNNAQTISTHTTQISALNTGLSAKVSQTDFNTLSGRVTSAENNITAKANELSSKITSVEGKIPTSIGGTNLLLYTADPWQAPTGYYQFSGAIKTDETLNGSIVYKTSSAWASLRSNWGKQLIDRKNVKVGDEFTYSIYAKTDQTSIRTRLLIRFSGQSNAEALTSDVTLTNEWQKFSVTFKVTQKMVASQTKLSWVGFEQTTNNESGKYVYYACNKLERGNIATDYSPAPEDAIEEISSLSSELKQTKDGITLLATKTELNTAKSDLQSGITTATNKANAAQSAANSAQNTANSAQNTANSAQNKANSAQNAANSNAQTISTHTTQISALNTGLQAKVSQTEFNTLSGRVTTAENNITAKANELSSKITSVEGKIPTNIGTVNLIKQSTAQNGLRLGPDAGPFQDSRHELTDWIKVEPNTTYTLTTYENVNESNMVYSLAWYSTNNADYSGWIDRPTGAASAATLKGGKQYKSPANAKYAKVSYPTKYSKVKFERGNIATDYNPNPDDYDAALTKAQSEIKQTTDAIKASVSSVQTAASNAQSTANTAVSKADAAQAGVNTLDSTTVKSASLTINADGIVMKAGKSTTDVANAIGSYFSVNQNAINLFSDKINVKANMIVNGAITSDKIASKSINTAHLNGKIITADVISSNAVTAGAIKAGAVTTDKMSANSINGDRIAAGTLDAAKIKAGSITASQIASGTITSNQIKAGSISTANIAAGAITGDKIAAGAIDANKIAANAITANMIRGGQLKSTNGATSFDLNAGTLTFNNNYGYIQRVASDKVFEITTVLTNASADVRESLSSAFMVRKSDNSRKAGIGVRLYNPVGDKPTAQIDINADSLNLLDSQNTPLLSVNGSNTYLGNWNIYGWGDIPLVFVNGGLTAKDVGLEGHIESLKNIIERLCTKTGIVWL